MENEFLTELQDDLQRERLGRLWHSFGKVMVGVSLGIVLITVAVVIRQDRREAAAGVSTAQFIKGIERMNIEDYKGAIAAFDALSADVSSPYYGLAMLRKAEAQTKNGDAAGAQKTYQALAANDPVWGGLGKMHVSGDKPIEPNRNSPFYYSEAEWRGWQLMQQGKKDEATKIFSALANDNDAPHTLRGRLQAVLHYATPSSDEGESHE